MRFLLPAVLAASLLLTAAGCQDPATQTAGSDMIAPTPPPRLDVHPTPPADEGPVVTWDRPLTPSPRPTPPAPAMQTHTVQRGDTLWNISERYLGSGRRYREILQANPDITDETRLPIGKVLQIPSR